MVTLRRQYLERQLSALAARVRILKGERLTFDEESKALYDAVAPTYPDSHFQQILDQAGEALSRQGSARRRATRRFGVQFVIPPAKLDAVFKLAIQACRERTRGPRQAAGRRTVHGRVRHEQVVERLQLVPGRVPQPDSGQHRPADLHRSRGRSRVPRGLSRPSRLQRAAREAPREGSRLDRVLGLPAVLAAVADRRRDRELRHRGRVSRQGACRVRTAAFCFRRQGSIPRRRPPITTCRRSSISCRTPATKPRDGISTARSTRRRRRPGSSSTR